MVIREMSREDYRDAIELWIGILPHKGLSMIAALGMENWLVEVEKNNASRAVFQSNGSICLVENFSLLIVP